MLAPTPALGGGPPDSAPDPAGRTPLRVALASDLRLIAEAVVAALSSRGFEPVRLAWPPSPADASPREQLVAADPAVAVLLYDVDMSIRMAAARSLIRSWSGPWLVLTSAPPNPLWGGLVSAGAAAVAPSDTALADIDDLVRRLAAGQPVPGRAELQLYVESWEAVQRRYGDLQRRLDRLAPRELAVLDMLRQGIRVAEIAHRSGLPESTVRTRVRAVLRKLGVRSQLSAWAMLNAVDSGVAGGVAGGVPAPRQPPPGEDRPRPR